MARTPQTGGSESDEEGRGSAVREGFTERFGDAPFFQRVLETAPAGAVVVDDSETVVFAN